MTEPEIREVGTNIYLIDENLYGLPHSGAVYLISEDRKALIDSGPATSAATILEALRRIGVMPEEIDLIILTHIHLDHAGGSGTLLKSLTSATVIAHQRAIRHLVDPSKLIPSAIAAQGEGSAERNGEMLPLPVQRLRAAQDCEELKLSERQTLTLLECPGHAPHELCIYESLNRGIFVGDAVGHIVEGTNVIVPITPPPSFDLALYLKTLERLNGLQPTHLYFSHFGVSPDVKEKLDAAARELKERNAIIAQAFAENRPQEAAARVISHIRQGLAGMEGREELLREFWLEHDVKMSAQEHIKYFTAHEKG